jgi:hypothetical protein
MNLLVQQGSVLNCVPLQQPIALEPSYLCLPFSQLLLFKGTGVTEGHPRGSGGETSVVLPGKQGNGSDKTQAGKSLRLGNRKIETRDQGNVYSSKYHDISFVKHNEIIHETDTPPIERWSLCLYHLDRDRFVTLLIKRVW